MTVTLKEIQEAQKRIEPYVLRTPLVRVPALDSILHCRVFVKAECMQVTNAFKLRGAMNRVLSLSPEELSHGLVAASSGNHGKAISYAAKMLGTTATIVIPDTAAKVKVDAIAELGAKIVFSDVTERFKVAARISEETGATLIPPFNDEHIMAGQGTAGIEIVEQCPEVDAVIVPVSGGGLIGGVSTAVKSLSPKTSVYGAEPAVLPRYSKSLEAGHPVKVQKARTIADALVSVEPGDLCFPSVAKYVDQVFDVDEEFILRGMKALLMGARILCEPSSGIGVGAVLQGLVPVKEDQNVCFLVSGGSVGFDQLAQLEDISYK